MTAPTEYDIGDVVVLTATFTVNGTLVTPTTTTLTILLPDGTELTPTPTTPSTGVKRAEVTITDVPGNWYYRWVGTGAAAGAEEGVIVVRKSTVL